LGGQALNLLHFLQGDLMKLTFLALGLLTSLSVFANEAYKCMNGNLAMDIDLTARRATLTRKSASSPFELSSVNRNIAVFQPLWLADTGITLEFNRTSKTATFIQYDLTKLTTTKIGPVSCRAI
jgi:hypothetical protein